MCATIFRQHSGDQAKPLPFSKVNFSRKMISAYACQSFCFRPSMYWRRHVRTCSNHMVHILHTNYAKAKQTFDGLQVRGFGRHSFIIIVILHNYAFIFLGRWRRCTYILTKMLCGLFDKVARLMKADAVSLGVAHRLTNRGIIRLTGVAVLRWTL